MHPNADNYNSSATADDGSCLFPGCTDPIATNYSFGDNTLGNTVTQSGDPYLPPGSPSGVTSAAALDNGSCVYPAAPVSGCTHPDATNYNSSATTDDGSCEWFCDNIAVKAWTHVNTPNMTAGCPYGWCTTGSNPALNPALNGPFPSGGTNDTLTPKVWLELNATGSGATSTTCQTTTGTPGPSMGYQIKIIPPNSVIAPALLPWTPFAATAGANYYQPPMGGSIMNINFLPNNGTYYIQVRVHSYVLGTNPIIFGYNVHEISFNVQNGCMDQTSLNYDSSANIHRPNMC